MARQTMQLDGPACAVSYRDQHEQQPHAWGLEVRDGPNIAVWRENNGQWAISILSEDMPPNQHDAEGNPHMEIALNDSPIYKLRRPPDDAKALKRELAQVHAQLWKAVPELRREASLVRALVEATGRSPDEIRRDADLDALAGEGG